ncbi:MAG: response regulator, partial [Steroidobacteraceae bacterium]|nr:response regulator [Steroidobacteraceae bacterium]MDW8259719.1 response regulator [Gammaproteobacteria bacterium]
ERTAAPAREPAQRSAVSSVQDARQPSVLVVDDERAVAQATALLLGVEGYRVEVALGRDDVRALLQRPDFAPAAVVADLHLSHGETGPEIVRELRLALGRAVPAIFVSGDTSSVSGNACALEHATIMSKPVDPELLLRAVRRYSQAA